MHGGSGGELSLLVEGCGVTKDNRSLEKSKKKKFRNFDCALIMQCITLIMHCSCIA